MLQRIRNFFVQILVWLYTPNRDLNMDLYDQVYEAIFRPIASLSEVQKEQLKEGKALILSITDRIIADILGTDNYRYLTTVQNIVQEVSQDSRFLLELLPEHNGKQTLYCLKVSLPPEDRVLIIDETEPNDDATTAIAVIEEPPPKTMAAHG